MIRLSLLFILIALASAIYPEDHWYVQRNHPFYADLFFVSTRA